MHPCSAAAAALRKTANAQGFDVQAELGKLKTVQDARNFYNSSQSSLQSAQAVAKNEITSDIDALRKLIARA
jgi:hypothetical protein